jgi:hypothetical protein
MPDFSEVFSAVGYAACRLDMTSFARLSLAAKPITYM